MEEEPSSSSSSPLAEAPDAPYKSHLLQGDFCLCALDHVQKLRQPDASPISTYAWDSDLPAGCSPQIVVNGSYICYFPLSSGSVGILGRNVAARGLFCGHTSIVSDMAFFAETEDLVASVSSDGSLLVGKIMEQNNSQDDFRLHEEVTLAIKFEGSQKDLQPRVCWHPSLQEWLVICIGDCIFTVNIKEAQENVFNLGLSEDALVCCQTSNPIDGVNLTGQHDAEVTNISMFSGQSLYIASASRDGMVKIWQGSEASLLAVLTPYEGQPVGSAVFVSCPQKPNKAVLLTQDATLERLQLWVPETSSASMDNASWCSVQTLKFTTSIEGDDEQKFLTQLCPVQEAGLLLFGSVRTSAVYVIHLRFEEASGAACMDYLAELCVPMPVLSLKGMADTGSDLINKGTIRIFCMHTQAIHEYHLNILHLLPHGNEPSLLPTNLSRMVRENLEIHPMECPERNNGPGLTSNNLTGCVATRGNVGPTSKHDNAGVHSGAGFGSWVEVPNWVAATIKKGMKVGFTETTHVKHESSLSPLASESDSVIFMSKEDEASTLCSIKNTALPGDTERAPVLGGHPEGVEETQEATPEMHELAGNHVEKQNTRVIGGFEPHSVEETIMEDTCRSGETFTQASPSLPNNPLEDLSVHISAAQESINLVLTSQMEIQQNFCSVVEASLAEEIECMDLSVEERLNSYYNTCLDPVWMKLDAPRKDSCMFAHQECVHQLEAEINKMVDGEHTTDSLKGAVLSLFGPKIGELITASVENIITIALSNIGKGWNENLLKSLEVSVGGILKRLVKAHMESASLTIWKHLMQDELCSCFQQQALPKVTQSWADIIDHVKYLLQEGTTQAFVLAEQQLTAMGLALTSSLKETLRSLLSMASSLNQELQDVEIKALQEIEHSYVRQDIYDELSQLLQQSQVEDALLLVLSLRNEGLVWWLCKQVNPRTLFNGSSPPSWLTQGLILALVERLAVDLRSDSLEKLAWIEQACLAVNPSDCHNQVWQMQASLRQVYVHLQCQIHLFSNDMKLLNQLHLIMHIVNSLMVFCTK